jgi:polyhydroxyalkanoate synthase
VLADSGHIAGIISPPGSKYGHWQNPNLPKSPTEWFETANLVQTSWWPAWEEWVSRHAGGSVKAREPGGSLQPIEDAPGSYVRARIHTAAANQGNTHKPHQDFLRDRL